MFNLNNFYKKHKDYTGNVNVEEFKEYIRKNTEGDRTDVLLDYLAGKDIKKLAKEYHLASSRITNLFYLIADRYWKEVLSKIA